MNWKSYVLMHVLVEQDQICKLQECKPENTEHNTKPGKENS